MVNKKGHCMNYHSYKTVLLFIGTAYITSINGAAGPHSLQNSLQSQNPLFAKQTIIRVTREIEALKNHYAKPASPSTRKKNVIIQSKILAIEELLSLFDAIQCKDNYTPFARMVQQQIDGLKKQCQAHGSYGQLRNSTIIEQEKQVAGGSHSIPAHLRPPDEFTWNSAKIAPSRSPTPNLSPNHSPKPSRDRTPSPVIKLTPISTPSGSSSSTSANSLVVASYKIIPNAGSDAKKGKKRTTMEDTQSIFNPEEARFSLFAIFDGHGGDAVSNYLRETLGLYIIGQLSNLTDYTDEIIKTTIKQAIIAIDELILRESTFNAAGSTAIIAIIDKETKKLFIVNLGDSRAILIKPRKRKPFEQLSTDHTASNPLEQQRIKDAGGHIFNIQGKQYVAEGIIAVTRSFGDKNGKITADRDGIINLSPIMSEPEINAHCLQPEDKFIILASDGVWEALQNEDAEKIVVQYQHQQPKDIAQKLVAKAVEKSDDDLSAIVIRLTYNQ
jgi:serine/threonine protein phosphatase PrpC